MFSNDVLTHYMTIKMLLYYQSRYIDLYYMFDVAEENSVLPIWKGLLGRRFDGRMNQLQKIN